MLGAEDIKTREIEVKHLCDRVVKAFEAIVFREEHGVFVCAGRFNAPASMPYSDLWKAVAVALGCLESDDPDFDDLVGVDLGPVWVMRLRKPLKLARLRESAVVPDTPTYCSPRTTSREKTHDRIQRNFSIRRPLPGKQGT